MAKGFNFRKREAMALLYKLLISLALIIIDPQKLAQATECFPLSESLLPKVNYNEYGLTD